MGLHKILKIVAMILALLGIIFAAMLAGGNESQIGSILYVAYAVLAIVLAAVVIFTLANTFANPANLKKTLTSLGAFVALAVICYAMASGEETPLKDGDSLSANGSKLIGGGLYLFYALIVIAGGTMLFTGIKKMIK